MTGSATLRAKPSLGSICILNPGAAFTSKIAPPFSSSGVDKSLAIISIPQMSNPMMRAIRSAKNILLGCTYSVTSVDVPPVLKFAVGLRKRISLLGRILSKVSSLSDKIFSVT